MIEVADFLTACSFKIGAFKIHINEFSYDEAQDVFGPSNKIFQIIGHEEFTLDTFERSSEGRVLLFSDKDGRVTELHLELEQDMPIKDLAKSLGIKPSAIINRKLKYLFFGKQLAGRIMDEKRRTLDLLGFFNEQYLRKEKLPLFFLSGIAYDPLKLRLLYEE